MAELEITRDARDAVHAVIGNLTESDAIWARRFIDGMPVAAQAEALGIDAAEADDNETRVAAAIARATFHAKWGAEHVIGELIGVAPDLTGALYRITHDALEHERTESSRPAPSYAMVHATGAFELINHVPSGEWVPVVEARR
jgi:hypothetical protein